MDSYRQAEEWLRDHIEKVAPHMYPNGKRTGGDWCVGSIDGEAPTNRGSFKILMTGPRRGVYTDFADGINFPSRVPKTLCTLWKIAFKISLDDHGAFFRSLQQYSGQDFGWKPKDNTPVPVLGLARRAARKSTPKNDGLVPSYNGPERLPVIDWMPYKEALSNERLQFVSVWRNYTLQQCTQLVRNELIGARGRFEFAFPYRDEDRRLVGVHLCTPPHKGSDDGEKSDWRYDPSGKGLGSYPFVIGEFDVARVGHVTESQWDWFSLCFMSGQENWLEDTDHVAIITRGASGASNLAKVVDNLKRAETIYIWPQNDKPDKHGNIASENWLETVLAILARAGLLARVVRLPAGIKDHNELLKKGGTRGDLEMLIQGAKLVEPSTLASEQETSLATRMAASLATSTSDLDNDDSEPIRRSGDYKKARASIGEAPSIILPSCSVELIDTAALLFRKLAQTERFFIKGGIIVELLEEREVSKVLHPVSAASLCSRIEEYFQVWVWRMHEGKPMLKQATCPEETAKKLLFTTEALTRLKPIQTVIRCPVAIEGVDGEIKILGPGYHVENGGILVLGDKVVTDVPLKEALESLKSLVAEFDFQTPGDRSRAIASLLSPAFAFGRLLKGRIPVDVAEADQSQAGKTFRQKLVAAIYKETPRLIARRDGGVGSLDESFSSAVIQGCPFLQFDNLRGIFDSQFVEAFLTSDYAPVRVPYRGEIVVGTRNFFILMTSNGVETTRDFANRAAFVCIRKRTGYRFKYYPEGDLLAHVKANQAYYLGCVFSVIREWLASGKPGNLDETRHDFGEWAQVMDLLVTKLFAEAPLMDNHLAAQERVSNPALNFTRLICMALMEDRRLGEELTASDFADIAETHHIEFRTVKARDSENASRQVGLLLSRGFKESSDLLCEDFRITRKARPVPREDGRGSYETKFYRIEKVTL